MSARRPVSRPAVVSLLISGPWIALVLVGLLAGLLNRKLVFDLLGELLGERLATALMVECALSAPISVILALTALVQVIRRPGQVRSLRLAEWACGVSLLHLWVALAPFFNHPVGE